MRVIVAGGIGFIGRHLVAHLAENKIATKILVLDKVLPEVAGLTEKELSIFKSDLVIFKQLNLARESSVRDAFQLDGGNWDYVINLAAITKYSQPQESYQENIVEVARQIAAACAANNVKRLVHVSTAQVYDSGKKPSTEESKLKPWTMLAKASLQGEEAVRETDGLKYVIVRPAIVYGPGDIGGITPRLITGAVYQRLNETMEMLWSKDLRINTVHVRDVVRALTHLCTAGNDGEVYNLADSGDSSQGSINKFLEKLFGIKTDFISSMKSKLYTSLAMKTVAETANDKHLAPWGELLKEHDMVGSALTPYLDEELLYNNSLSVDGTKITTTGFEYKYPEVTLDLLVEVIKDFEEKRMFPPGLLKV